MYVYVYVYVYVYMNIYIYVYANAQMYVPAWCVYVSASDTHTHVYLYMGVMLYLPIYLSIYIHTYDVYFVIWTYPLHTSVRVCGWFERPVLGPCSRCLNVNLGWPRNECLYNLANCMKSDDALISQPPQGESRKAPLLRGMERRLFCIKKS